MADDPSELLLDTFAAATDPADRVQALSDRIALTVIRSDSA